MKTFYTQKLGRSLVFNRFVAALICIAGTALACAAPPAYRSGYIIHPGAAQRVEAQHGGPQAPLQEDGTSNPAQPSVSDDSDRNYLRIQGGKLKWLGRLPAGTDPRVLDEFAVGARIQFRVQGNRLFLRRSNGTEIELALIKGTVLRQRVFRD